MVAMVQPTQAQRPRAKMDKKVESISKKGGNARTRVIVRTTASDRPTLKNAWSRQGHKIRREHRVLSALTMEIPARSIDALSRAPGVLSISIDAPVRPKQTTELTWTSGTLLQQTLGVDPASGSTGAGVGVAVIDSGIAPLPDFDTRITAFYDFTTTGNNKTPPFDDYGHGTHVAGLIGGTGAASGGLYTGVAPGVSLIGLKVLTGSGSGYTSDVIEAIEFATINKGALGIDIINLSLGHPPFESATTDPLVLAVQNASAAGIVVIASAGNYGINPSTGTIGYGGILVPGNAPSAITVGAGNTMLTADRSDDLVMAYSSRGPSWYDGYAKPDVVAPGHRLIAPAAPDSTLVAKYPNLLVPDETGALTYLRLSGTSMATAVTSGTVALLIETSRAAFPTARPELTPNTVKAMLQFTAFTMHDENLAPYNRLTQGSGGLNADGALTLARAIDTSVPAGEWWLAWAVSPYSDISGVLLTWAQNLIWGENLIWGDSVYTHRSSFASNVVWGDNIVWGENVVWGENLIWGDNVVWGDNLIWGDNIVWGENVVWGDNLIWGENVVWGEDYDDDNVVWGENVLAQ
ncbi:MAG: S8 family serine peptidase [Acidobacteria bacterium]|nr:S8 family serine peptidase [Acidobacteriota bacterium]